MESPKFPHKKVDIEQVINKSNLKSKWKSKVRDAIRKFPIPDSLEYLDFHVRLDSECAAVASEVGNGAYLPHPPQRLLAEKSKGFCRQLVFPMPRDALILQALSDALWVELKKKAPSKNAHYAPNDHSFSKMIRGQTNEYGPVNAWLSFQKTLFNFAKTYPYIVITDIANYYDFISYDHLRNILADLAIAKEHSLDLLIFTLSHMLWQPDYMPRVQVGLPQVNLDGARLLAHCFLFEIDRLFVGKKNMDYARYMDDMDIGVESIVAAKTAVRDLDLALQTRQVRLNSGKTVILNSRDARHHYRVAQNYRLDRLEEAIIFSRKNGGSVRKYLDLITTLISRGLARGHFIGGNGEKILKRLINYARQFNAEIKEEDFTKIIFNWPGCRSQILTWWSHCRDPSGTLYILRDFVNSGYIVDHLSYILVADAIVAARLKPTLGVHFCILELIQMIGDREKWRFLSALWLRSKYGSDEELLEMISIRDTLWSSDQHLSRMVGGMFPRFINSRRKATFENIIRRSNLWAISVFDFHRALSETINGYTAIHNFIKAPNPSLPNRISHAKFLMLISALNNPTIAPSAVITLKAKHAFALADAYYISIS